MPEPTEPHAQPIPQTGAPEWAPTAEDDSLASEPPRRPQDVRAIFFGADGLRAGWSVLIFLAILWSLSAAVNFIIRAVFHPSTERTHLVGVGRTLGQDLVGFAVIAASAFLVSLIERRSFGRYGIGLPTSHRMAQFLAGGALGLGLLSLLVFTLKTAGLLAFDGVLLHGGEAVQHGLLWLLAFIGVGLMEEFLTRGFLQFTLTRGFAGLARAANVGQRTAVAIGFWVTALLFSALFGLGHTSNPGESPLGILSAGLIGLVFAFSLWRTGSLWWAIGFHAAWDWAQSYLFGTADSGLLIEHHLLASHPIGKPLMSGGLTGPEGSIFVLVAILITWLTVLLALKPEPGSYADPNWTPNDRAYL